MLSLVRSGYKVDFGWNRNTQECAEVQLDFNFRCSYWRPHNKMVTDFCKFHAWSLYTQPTLVGNPVFNKTSYFKLFCPMVNGFVLTRFLLDI